MNSDSLLFALIIVGIALTGASFVVEYLSWRSDMAATLRASLVLRQLYQRAMARTKNLPRVVFRRPAT